MINMKKQRAALIAAAAGVCVFTTAAFANYSTSNGYDSLKKSLWGVMESKNFTADFNVAMRFDGNDEDSMQSHYEFDADGKKSYSKNSGVNSNGSEYGYERWEDASKSVSAQEDGTYLVFDNTDYGFGSMLEGFGGNEESGRKVFRFLELCADTVIGDLRNNVNYIGEEDGKPKYNVSLTSVQIPEIINTGLSAMVAVSNANVEYVNEDGTEDLDAVMNTMVDAYVDSINGEFSLNDDGTFNNGTLKVAFVATDRSGAEHTLEFECGAAFSNYGTTDPQIIDLSQIDSSKVEYVNYEDTEYTVDDGETVEINVQEAQ